jgi:hypothetical protein
MGDTPGKLSIEIKVMFRSDDITIKNNPKKGEHLEKKSYICIA